jgi:hypothetical protein
MVDLVGLQDGSAVVKRAPYQAEAQTELTRVLADGNRIVNKISASVARDSEGRTRRQETMNAVGGMLPVRRPLRLCFINDPVAGVSYVLDLDRHTAHKATRPPRRERRPPGKDERPPAPAEQTESLGTRTIEGLEAEGTRTTMTLPAGTIGNSKPIQIVSERWYSPELQLVILSKRQDPLMGDTVFRLTGITRTEPDGALFEVPQGFTLTEGPPSMPGGHAGPPPAERN